MVNKKDSTNIFPKYIDEPTEKNGGVSIKLSKGVLGINKIVVDYNYSIDELLKKIKNENAIIIHHGLFVVLNSQFYSK